MAMSEISLIESHIICVKVLEVQNLSRRTGRHMILVLCLVLGMLCCYHSESSSKRVF